MLCQECNRYNEAGSKFCGFCGEPLLVPVTRENNTFVREGSSQDGRNPWIPRQTPEPVKVPSQPKPSPDSNAANLATTRWLCAAVTLDSDLEHRVIERVLEEEQRAVVTTPGVDLVTVLKYALAAHRRRVIRDSVLLADLFALVITFVVVRSAPLVFVLLVIAWGAVFTERYVALHGPVLEGLRPGRFDPRKVQSPPRASYAGRQLQRVAAAGTSGNLTLYSGFPPFRGYGTVRSSWSFAVDITRPPDSVTRPGQRGKPIPFSTLEVYDWVKAGLRELDLPGLELTDRLFVNGRDIAGDQRFFPDSDGPPATSVDPELMRDLLAEPEEWARPYLTIGMTSWQGDLVMTSFVRFLVSRTNLFVEAAHTVVPPLRAAFKAIDEHDPSPDPGEILGLATRSLFSTLPRMLGSVGTIAHEWGAKGRRARKRRRVEETRDYGALTSVRELAADTRWQRYFQIFDDERFVKVIEQRMFRSLVDFLKEKNVDTTSLESRAEMLINNGVMFGDNANVKGSQVGGSKARLAGLASRAGGGD
jgi:hypothetical protein